MKRLDPMKWLVKHILDLFKEEKEEEVTSSVSSHEERKKSSVVPKSTKSPKADPYDWMTDLFLGLFKKRGEKKIDVPEDEDGVFKINPEAKKRSDTRK